MTALRTGLAYVAAVIVAAVLGTVAQTQFNLASIAGLGAEIPTGIRLRTTLLDLAGFTPLYAIILAVALGLALPVAALLARRFPAARTALYAAAGAAGVYTALRLMNYALSLDAIAATRSLAGLLSLVAAGAAGGLAFALLCPRRSQAQT